MIDPVTTQLEVSYETGEVGGKGPLPLRGHSS